jgi:predicted amidohydrolase
LVGSPSLGPLSPVRRQLKNSGPVTVLAACQLAPAVGDAVGNRARALAAIRATAEDGADVVVVPELVDSGYVFADRAEAQRLAEPVERSVTLQGWSALAAEMDVVIIGGWCELGPSDALFNSGAIVDRGGVRATYRKAHLWDFVVVVADRRPPSCTDERR